MRFEYDPKKSASNLAKHGIDFEAAQELWDGPVMVFGAKPGTDEQRSLVLGMIGGKHWTAITTERAGATRIISVRRSRREEARRYDEGI